MQNKYVKAHSFNKVVSLDLIGRAGFNLIDSIRSDMTHELSHALMRDRSAVRLVSSVLDRVYEVRYTATVYTTTPEDFSRAVEEEVARRMEAAFACEVEARLKKAVDKEIQLRRSAAEFVMKHGYAPPATSNNPKEHHFD